MPDSADDVVSITNKSGSNWIVKLTYYDNSKMQIELDSCKSFEIPLHEADGLLYPAMQFYKVNPTPVD